MDLAPDFDEFIGCLIAHGVDFVIVGAYALAHHGAPRFTGDLDVLIQPTVENAARLLNALHTFGFPISDLTPAAVADRRKLLEMGVPPVQIHVMSTISGVEWEEAWADRVEAPLGSHTVPLLGRDVASEQARRGPPEGSRRHRRPGVRSGLSQSASAATPPIASQPAGAGRGMVSTVPALAPARQVTTFQIHAIPPSES